jgi:lipid A 3-O-deacylase
MLKFRLTDCACGLALLICAIAPAYADTPEDGTVSLLFENDLFYKTDRDYSNGVQAAWTSPPEDTPGWAVSTARILPFFEQEGEVRASYALGQNMYTPSNLAAPNPPADQRPYAGFLYASLGLIDENIDKSRLDQIELQIGVIGPMSLAEETQKFIHRAINDRIPQGWHYQLRGEPGVILSYDRSVKVFPRLTEGPIGFDVEPDFGGAIGNVYDYASAGAMARVGFNLPDDYGPVRIEPSLPGSNFFEPQSALGAYIFAGVEGRAIARNLFLDGNSFETSRHVEKIPFVGDAQLGAAIAFRAFRLTFTHVFRSKEYKTQTAADQFGAINLSFRY